MIEEILPPPPGDSLHRLACQENTAALLVDERTDDGGFASTVITGRVYTDKTHVFYEIPILLTAEGVFEVLVDYFLEHWDTRSPAWMLQVTSSVRLFLEYLCVHADYSDEKAVFQNFRQRLLTGTVSSATGEDPSGLLWSARGPRQSSRIIMNLTDLLVWWAAKNPGRENPALAWRGSRYDLRIADAAYHYKRNAAFLGHTWSAVQETSHKPGARSIGSKWHTPPKVEHGAAPAFPEDRILDLIFKGFKVGSRYNYRDMLVTLLLNGAGFRVSEPFHLYLWDVTEDPSQSGSALVLIHHPAWGSAPPDPNWIDLSGKQRTGQRVEYLSERFGLSPRDWGFSTAAAGWKGGMHETAFGGYYKQAYWFIPEFGKLFWEIWHLYIAQVQRISPDLRQHPFAFINTLRAPIGDPYKLGKFADSHAAAVRRIGLVPGKHFGTTVHGHRHAYGQRLRRAGISKEMIRRFMHHANVDSQEVYTKDNRAECLMHLRKAVDRLDEVSQGVRREIMNASQYDALK